MDRRKKGGASQSRSEEEGTKHRWLKERANPKLAMLELAPFSLWPTSGDVQVGLCTHELVKHKDGSRLDEHLFLLEQPTGESRDDSPSGSLQEDQCVQGGQHYPLDTQIDKDNDQLQLIDRSDKTAAALTEKGGIGTTTVRWGMAKGNRTRRETGRAGQADGRAEASETG